MEASRKYKGICGYMGGDNFCLFIPTSRATVQTIQPLLEDIYKTLEFPDGFAPAMGVYLSTDRHESTITLYDRALSALSEIKGDYIRHIHFYSTESHQHQREDKLLLMEVKDGLAKGEFIFYVQPQVNEKSGKIVGGEALVRWLHDGQLIPPGRFIPVLEKTGYVYAVDAYVWESVCKWQRGLIDRGIEPVPVSVNVSRVDFYFDNIAECFIRFVEKYDLDPALIGVEITESAFTDNTEMITEAIAKLHDAGFHILMDDFGSGSSSLSMLHSMNVDVIKTDVQFMSKDMQDKRAVSIVESIISMAHMIGLSVITEGVETEGQKDNLISMGENYAQGFYFYKPMPAENFEALLRDPENVTIGYVKRKQTSSGQLRFRDVIQRGVVSESLLDNIIRATAVLKVEGDDVSLVQINELYASLLGIAPGSGEATAFTDFLDSENREILLSMLNHAKSHTFDGGTGMIRFNRSDGEAVELNMRLFLLYSFDNHRLYLSIIG